MRVLSIPKINVGDIGIKEVFCLSPNLTLKEAAKFFIEKNISGAPVVDNGKLVGILSLYDIAKHIDNTNKKVEEAMSKSVITISKDEHIYKALEIMNKNNIGRLIITENDKIIGIITRTDILKIISGQI